MPREPSQTFVGAVLLVVALLAAACDGGAERTTTSTTNGAGTATTTSGAVSSTSTTAAAPTEDGSSSTTTAVTTTSTRPDPAEGPRPLAEVSVALEPVADFVVPTAFRVHPDGSGWVAEKAGRVRSFATGAVALDIRSSVRDRGEQGFLGIAFAPDGEHLYVSYNDRADDGASVIAEYRFREGVAVPGSRREVLRVAQPYSNHNGGDVHFGPDGYLWFGLGDGGDAGDPHEHAQDPDTLLGSVLRIDPDRPSDGRAYGIPPDNPFADGGGRPEIWLYGVRNPWRYTFDPANTDLWIGDVGQDAWEEIDLLPSADGRGRGANLGWNQLEGTHVYDGPAPAGSVLPVFEYPHDEGCSITGGVVYRGSRLPELSGAYLFADLCRTTLRAIRVEDGVTTESRVFPVDAGSIISFGVDPDGEVLLLTQEGTVHALVRP